MLIVMLNVFFSAVQTKKDVGGSTKQMKVSLDWNIHIEVHQAMNQNSVKFPCWVDY